VAFTTRYVGIIPALNSMVNSATIRNALRPGRSLRDRGYAINVVSTMLTSVPTTVMNTVTDNARGMAGSASSCSYASNVICRGITTYPPLRSTSPYGVSEAETTNSKGNTETTPTMMSAV
jgi:hypothetical protein